MRNRKEYLDEVRRRLLLMFRASRDGHKASPPERHRLEGFMQAGSFFGLATSKELKKLMEEVHCEVFGQTIKERQASTNSTWVAEQIDYSEYDSPSFDRSH